MTRRSMITRGMLALAGAPMLISRLARGDSGEPSRDATERPLYAGGDTQRQHTPLYI